MLQMGIMLATMIAVNTPLCGSIRVITSATRHAITGNSMIWYLADAVYHDLTPPNMKMK